MEGKRQHQIAFYLTGRSRGSALQPMNGRFRPALMARFGDLSSLRYDFPLVLNREAPPEQALRSLSRMVDVAVEGLGDSPDRDRIARHGYRIERELRRDLIARGNGDLANLWQAAATRLASDGDKLVMDSAERLWAAFCSSGELVDADSALPSRAVLHAWNAIKTGKTRAFRQKAEYLLVKLRDILAAEMAGSAVGRTPERLRAGLGSSFAASFNFDMMSRILVEAKPALELSEKRRNRIQALINVLERQRFFPLGVNNPKPYEFTFSRCSDALKAYQERHAEAVELVKTLAVAGLEASGDYRESTHDVLFEEFGANGLDARQLAELPDYLVCTNSHTLDPAETARLVELLAAGLPIKVLVQTDDVLEPAAVAEGHVALGRRARQLVNTAIGLTDVYVLQVSASHLFQLRDALLRGLSYEGPTLLSVFSGASGHTGQHPTYLVAAAAMESRAFPALVYDPSGGSDWATRLRVADNPKPESDWPVHTFTFEDERLQSQLEPIAFTLADFMVMDDRFQKHFAIVPKADWCDAMIPASAGLQADPGALPSQAPFVTLVDDEGRLQRAVLDRRTLLETQRCLTMWHSLQELGGIHNSHAERLLAQVRQDQAAALQRPSPPATAPAPTASEPRATTKAPVTESTGEESHNDNPYIETARCTTCNECTQRNRKMFAYNENKQAYIADPDAGTFRQLVEAAEGCQVSIIHPGKPRNPKEPGLEDLIRRAAEFA